MAKARRPPFAAAERFLGFSRGGPSLGAMAPAPDAFDDLPDLAEADVWYSAAAAAGDSGSPFPAASRQVEVAAEGRSAGQRAAPRRGVQGGLSQAFGDGPGRQVAASAPVEVPAWPARFAVPDAAVRDGDGGRRRRGRRGRQARRRRVGAAARVPGAAAGAGVGGGGRRPDAQGPRHVAGARRRLEPDGLRRIMMNEQASLDRF